MTKTKLFLIFLVLLLGIGLRSIEVINRNFLFGFDQGRDYLAVRKIVVERKPTLIGPEVGAGFAGLRGVFHGPYYYYFLILPFLFFSGDPYGGLVLMFVFGVVSLLLFFFFLQRNYGTKVALIGTLLTAVILSPQSRFMWNPHPATLFVLLVFWFIFKVSVNPPRYFFGANFFAGLVYGFQLAIAIPLTISLYLFVFFILKIRKLKTYLAGFLGTLLVYLPLVAFELRHGFMGFKAICSVFSNLLSGGSASEFLRNLPDRLSAFRFNFQSSFLLDGLPAAFLFIILLFSVIRYLRDENIPQEKNFTCFLLILILVTFSVFIFWNNAIWGHYLIHLHLVYILLFAILLVRARPFLLKIVLFLFLLLVVPGLFKVVKNSIHDFYDYGGVAKIKGKIEAIDYIYQDAGGEKFNVLVFTPPVYDYAYRYLLIWYGEKKYGYIPGEEKKGTFYLWIEPDLSKPWSYQGWLETVIKTGEVLKEVRLPSGFIIQKRHGQT